MGMAAVLVMWPGLFEHTFVSPSHGGSKWNLTLIGLLVSEERMFKEGGRRRTTEAYLSYKLTNESSAQVSWQNPLRWANKDGSPSDIKGLSSTICLKQPKDQKI